MSASWSAWVDRGTRVPVTVAVVVVAGLGVSGMIQIVLDRVSARPSCVTPALAISSGEVLERVALSFDALLADVYWIRAIQEYGGIRRSPVRERRYDRLYPLLDITTTLDPRFNIAYRFGAIFLAEAPPNGPGRPDLAIALLQKGLAAMPDRWQYSMDIGFVHYWWQQDYGEAARWFRRAAAMSGAPWWLRPLAARTLTDGGDIDGARRVWRQLLESTDDDWIRGEASRRLLQLELFDADLERYTAAAEAFAGRTGRWPRTWAEVGMPEAPRDPYGRAYRLDPEARRVLAAPGSPAPPPSDLGSGHSDDPDMRPSPPP